MWTARLAEQCRIRAQPSPWERRAAQVRPAPGARACAPRAPVLSCAKVSCEAPLGNLGKAATGSAPPFHRVVSMHGEASTARPRSHARDSDTPAARQALLCHTCNTCARAGHTSTRLRDSLRLNLARSVLALTRIVHLPGVQCAELLFGHALQADVRREVERPVRVVFALPTGDLHGDKERKG